MCNYWAFNPSRHAVNATRLPTIRGRVCIELKFTTHCGKQNLNISLKRDNHHVPLLKMNLSLKKVSYAINHDLLKHKPPFLINKKKRSERSLALSLHVVSVANCLICNSFKIIPHAQSVLAAGELSNETEVKDSSQCSPLNVSNEAPSKCQT